MFAALNSVPADLTATMDRAINAVRKTQMERQALNEKRAALQTLVDAGGVKGIKAKMQLEEIRARGGSSLLNVNDIRAKFQQRKTQKLVEEASSEGNTKLQKIAETEAERLRLLANSMQSKSHQTQASSRRALSKRAAAFGSCNDTYLNTEQIRIMNAKKVLHSPVQVICRFEIIVRTSSISGAGTDASVTIQLIALDGSSQSFVLSKSSTHKNKFEKGNADRFNFEGILVPGGVRRVRIGHDNSGFGAAWHLDNVTVSIINRVSGAMIESHEFNCGQWLGKRTSSKSASLLLERSVVGTLDLPLLRRILAFVDTATLLRSVRAVSKHWRSACRELVFKELSFKWTCRISDSGVCSPLTDSMLVTAVLGNFGGALEVDLSNCKLLTSTGLASLPLQMTSLCLSGCVPIPAKSLGPLTLKGTTSLSRFLKLRALDLSNCGHVSDELLISISNSLPNLTNLNLNNCTKISNRGLTAAAALCSNLEVIDLTNCYKISDTGLSALGHSCIRLKSLVLRNLDQVRLLYLRFDFF